MGRSILLQIINGYLAIAASVAGFVFLRYIIRNMKLGYPELRPAIILFALCVGTILLRFPIYVVRTLTNMGIHVSEPEMAYITGGLIMEVAFLCTIRVFAPEKWALKGVIGTIILSTVVVAASVVLVLWS